MIIKDHIRKYSRITEITAYFEKMLDGQNGSKEDKLDISRVRESLDSG